MPGLPPSPCRNTAKNAAHSCGRPQWLVSVRDLDEAEIALRFGVDILDFKEPLRGPLAPVTPEIWRSVLQLRCSDSVGEKGIRPPLTSSTRSEAFNSSLDNVAFPVLSAALGESEQGLRIASQVPPAFRYAKIGPSGCDREEDVLDLWRLASQTLSDSVELVAVAYADHENASCLSALQMVRLAQQAGLKRILVDTFDKSAGASVDLLGRSGIETFASLAMQGGLWWALAGSVTLNQASEMMRSEKVCHGDGFNLAPDCIAIRGAVCDGRREGTLSPQKMSLWQRCLRQGPPPNDPSDD